MRATILAAITIGLAACAQVPKESVELSATVGRDVAEIERSHRALVNIYYDKLEQSINRFVDQVYLPYQIGKTLEDPNVGGALSQAIQEAGQPNADDKTKKDTFEALGYYFLTTRGNVEMFRANRLKPLREQREVLLKRLDEAYRRVQNGNSIVTGYLASVVKISEEQNKILGKVGLPDLQDNIGQKADKLSQDLGKVADQVQAGKLRVNAAVQQADKLIELFDKESK